jgi:HlyD family secretion protein
MVQIIKKYWLGFVALVLIVAAAVLIYQKLHPVELAANLVEGTGQIDGDLINLNTKYPGRVSRIAVDDGVVVNKGMVVAVLDSREQQAQKKEIEAKIRAQNEHLKAGKIDEQIAQKSIPLELDKAQAQLKAAEAKHAAVQKNIRMQEDVLAQAKRDLNRSNYLYKTKSIDKHNYELARLKVDTEQEKLDALKSTLTEADSAIDAAEVGVKEAEASQKKLLSIQAEIVGVEAGIKALEASREKIDAILSEMTLKSPIDGYTVEKITNRGEVLGAGMTVATLIDPRSLYLKIFVDTMENGRIKLGDRAVIFLDAYPDRPIEAEVVNIAQRAEFTPKDVSVRSDRIQRVYAVRLKPLRPDPLLKLGIPAIGVISIDGRGLPRSLDEIPVL